MKETEASEADTDDVKVINLVNDEAAIVFTEEGMEFYLPHAAQFDRQGYLPMHIVMASVTMARLSNLEYQEGLVDEFEEGSDSVEVH